MKISFKEYIKTAKIGDSFIDPSISDKFILIKIRKKDSDAIEICKGKDRKNEWDKREVVIWENDDKTKIIPLTN